MIAMSLLVAVAGAQILTALYLHTRPSHEELLPGQKAAIEERLFDVRVQCDARGAPVKCPRWRVFHPRRSSTCRFRRRPLRNPSASGEGFSRAGDDARVAKLQQATALDPGNAEILAELAMTYESMQLFDRSNEVWRRLQSLGPAVGPLFELADLKLQVGVPPQGDAHAAQPGDATGISDGSIFGISELTLKREADPDAETRLLLRVGVKVRPDTPIDHTKVKIQVFFYDMVNNDQVVLTNAEVNYEWITPGHDWADTGTEVLDVTYLRPKRRDPVPGTAIENQPMDVPDSVEKAKRVARKAEAAASSLPTSESGPRRRLYRAGLLSGPTQAVRAEPARLLNLFPPPFTAPPQ